MTSNEPISDRPVLLVYEPLDDKIRAIRDLLSDPGKWTQAAVARDTMYRPVKPLDPHAIRWCLIGAFLKVSEEPSTTEYFKRALNLGGGSVNILNSETTEYLANRLGFEDTDALAEFNDTSLWVNVMAMLDSYIKARPRPIPLSAL